jgi:uncharacterized membrane protein YozB (DUF420 family)
MDAKVLYWTGALLNMAVLTGFALSGVRQIRRGEIARHKRSMQIAASLVVAFLISYGLKLATLGREDLSVWSSSTRNMLHFHELCVLVMMVGGGVALYLGRSFRQTSAVGDDPELPAADPARLARHRRLGRIAAVTAVLGVLSAAFVLAGMYRRL